MKIVVDGIEYQVRNNYLHRAVPRVVLNTKENGKYVSVQVEIKGNIDYDKEYDGYWYVSSKHKIVSVKFLNPHPTCL